MQSGDGSKGVAVGTRIAVIADPEDDVSTLEIPADEAPKKEASSPPPKAAEPSSPKETAPSKPDAPKQKGQGKEQTRPLYPSVELLLHANNISAKDIPPTGPNNRLLKGDVLAYLEKIPSSAPAKESSRITKLTHLDLSNIKPAAPKALPPKAAEAPGEAVADIPISITVPVSLSAVLAVQNKMQSSLGIMLPLSTFIARAIALANEDLPLTGKRTPTADELFNSIIGIDKISSGKRVSDGKFSPRIMAIPDRSGLAIAPKMFAAKKADPFDEIIGGKSKNSVVSIGRTGALGAVGESNIFSLNVKKEEEKRAKVFLERVKSVLEVEPGRLVL
jgi:pyruvate/2-oxoglutarate dehydrogenase complex dihydrolipoamide acyltransferase (E2) component